MISIAALGAATLFPPATLSRTGRAGTNGLLIALAVIHPLVMESGYRTAWIVDGILGLTGLIFSATIIEARPSLDKNCAN
ncbi:hypothetical protein MB02_04075 [Croceicoccus estronivorus]|uniref:hypothetical protein n=1 Tax=Croceicoccus estronivorus TaxID=1172626 RepID=UPI000830EC29|nr:hypothetical protein [Croceicoccus estronivorus]OCC24669.1 hypothetical protein MB02_04075 [Croceicoccus estronivorus]